MLRVSSRKTFLSLSALAAIVGGCTGDQNRRGIALNASTPAIFAPAPASGATLTPRDLVNRYRGQTEFLSPRQSYGQLESARGGPVAAAAPAASRADGGRRAIQESDLFKVGAGGLLYLLNDQRGLQIVSFAAGPDKPELLSRVAATGNYPKDMYYVEAGASKRLIVLENDWSSGSYSSEDQSRAIVYDATNPARPTAGQIVRIKGMIADSRMVGDVLYVASRTSNWSQYGGQQEPAGYVTSFKVRGGELEKVQEYRLQQAAASGELMGIAETQENGRYKYYLINVLSRTGWQWGDRESAIELVDVSDENGAVRPVMVVSARGVIARRSMAFVAGGQLVVASNFRLDKDDYRSPKMVSVEAFKLPGENPEILTETQAGFRRLRIEAAVEGKSPVEARGIRATMENEAELGVRGRFVRAQANRRGVSIEQEARQPATQLIKLVADSSAATRDDKAEGGSAELQDVRYQDGLIYAFWTPASMIDPLDLFSFDPEKGVSYISRLQFDGWIERAEPFMVGGKRYVVGLGWAVPATEEQDGRRRPQAAIFEVQRRGASWRTQQIAQLTLDSADIWTNFHASDKYVEIAETAPGVGRALFSAFRWNDGASENGGKVILFDINKAASGDDGALTDGPFLAGESGWVRRVFTNPEIQRVNVFSNRSLGVFDVRDATGSSIARATATLELARNVVAFAEVSVAAGAGKPASHLGAQIVSTGAASYLGGASNVEVRFVDPAAPDAEKGAVLFSQIVPGAYSGHLVDPAGNLVLLTIERKYTRIERPAQDGETPRSDVRVDVTGHVSRISLTAGGDRLPNSALASNSWIAQTDGGLRGGPFGFAPYLGFGAGRQSQFVALPDGSYLAQADGSIQIARIAQNLVSLQPVAIDAASCKTEGREGVQLRLADDGGFYLASSQTFEFAEYPNIQFAKNFVARAKIEGGALSCESSYNVPGRPLAFSAKGAIVDDAYAKDLYTRVQVYSEPASNDQPAQERRVTVTEVLGASQLASLTFGPGGVATLVDARENDAQGGARFSPIGGGALASLSGENAGRGYGYGYEDGAGAAPLILDFLSQGEGGLLQSRAFRLQAKVGAYPSIAALWPDGQGGALALITGSQRAQALRWTNLAAGGRPSIVPMQAQDERGEFGSAQDFVRAPGYFWSYGGSAVSRSADGRTFAFSLGFAGVQSARLAQ